MVKLFTYRGGSLQTLYLNLWIEYWSVIVTGVLAEMNHNVGFFLNKSKGWLRNSNNNSKLIYVGGLGAGVFNTYAQVFAKFKSNTKDVLSKKRYWGYFLLLYTLWDRKFKERKVL